MQFWSGSLLQFFLNKTKDFLSYVNESDMIGNSIMESTKRPQLVTMDEDRISQLPDCLIHQIFKSVPITNVVQTCVLSKRWETLWTSIQCLEFRDLGNNIHFEHFVDSVLLLRKPWDVDTLRLELPWHFDRDHVNVWIIYAIDHNVRVLDLEFIWFANEYELPNCLFTCQSLEELRVAGCDGILDFPVPISLKRLKKLHLYYLKFADVDLRNMISGCPMIETLHMEVCSISCTGEGEVDICSKSLKYLMIEHGLMYTVRFCTPNLLCLYYESNFVDGAWFIDMPYLDDATISDGVGETPVEVNVAALIKPVAKTKSLNLWGPWIELISEEELSKFPTFVNLKRLTVAKNCMYDFLAIACFLQHAPNLEYLALEMPVSDDRHCSCDLRESYAPGNTPKHPYLPFNCPRLKLVEIQCSDRGDVSDLVLNLVQNSISKPKIKIKIL